MLLSTAFSARIPNDLRDRRRPGRQRTLGGRWSSRPLLEVLEDRTLLNVDFVSNTNDSGTGSLRATISSASPGDTIKFESGVTGAITLTSGALPLAQNLHIEGPGANNLTISGNDASQVFDVKVGVTTTIAGLTIADGTSASGGGIYNAGTLTVSNSTLSGNAVSGGLGLGKVDIGAFESRGFTMTVTSGNNQQTAIYTSFAAPLVVKVSSHYGEPVAGGVVTFTAPAGGASATVPGTATINASGQAGIALVAANTTIGSYTVSASARGAVGTSFDLTNTPGIPTQLVIHTQPSATATAGRAFATQPVIYVEDPYGNLETGDNSTRVRAGLKTGTGPLHGTTTVRVVGGIARFSGLADSKAGSIVLVFTSGRLAKATSHKITINPRSGKGMVIGAKVKANGEKPGRDWY